VIGESLVITAGECKVDRYVDTIRPFWREHRQQQGAMQMVHDVIVGLEFCCASGVTARDDMSSFADNVSGHIAHLADGCLQLVRHRTRGELPARQLRNVHGQIARPLEVRGNAEPGRERTQVACDWLLTRDQIDGAAVGVLAKEVDGTVTVDHALGGAKIGVQQRLSRLRDRMAHELGHFDKLIGDGIKLVVIGVAHSALLPSAQASTRFFAAPPGPSLGCKRRGSLRRVLHLCGLPQATRRQPTEREVNSRPTHQLSLLTALRVPTIRVVRSTPAEPEPPSATAAVLATVAAALETGAVLLDDDDVLLANEAALALRVVHGRELTSRMLSRIAREARRTGLRIAQDMDLPWGSSFRAIHVVAAPVPGTAQVVLLINDLHESRRLEAVRRDFIANVSHELKTPVGAMLLLAEALRDATDDPVAMKQFTERMLHEAGRMSRLVQELLELSRLQGGEPLPAMESIRVSDVIADASDPLQVRAEAAGITLDVGPSEGAYVWGDRRQLTTALTNVIENAIAYSSPGSRVGVGVRVFANDDEHSVEITVTDEGVGIEKADQERVFERFYRVDTARSRATGGTGLGLAIVKHIANNHGGRVGLWSHPGVGSTFTLYLPVPPVATDGNLPNQKGQEL